jgi:hypothetical protein
VSLSLSQINSRILLTNLDYGSAGTDQTHLNSAGSKVFGWMVIDLLLARRPDLVQYFVSNPKLSALIKAGEFASGDEMNTL